MGCTDCSSKGGCDTRKSGERDLLAEILPSLYPTRRWGEIDDAARRPALADGGRRLARAAAESLRARTYFQPGADDEPCDFIYVLCVGREPGLWEVKHGAPPEGDGVRDKYLRAAISQIAPVATVQEVAMALDGDVLKETPRPGVYDPVLLKRTQKLIELLVDAGLEYLDFGLVTAPPLGFESGTYEEAFGARPGIVNYLFYPQPATAISTVLV